VQQGMSFRMDLFRKVGGFNIDNRTCWDYELLCKLIAIGANPALSKARFACFRMHAGSISGGCDEAATKRYRADLDRIHELLTAQTNESRRPHRFVFLRKMFGSPSLKLLRARELLAPWTLRQRWQADLRTDAKNRL
jgi:hypothetical protein